jgi:hypothetical protein
VRFADPNLPARQRSNSQPGDLTSFPKHPALDISRRTASAILVALEAIRTPHPFTPDLAEESANMSDLFAAGGGRAANGGARAEKGPVPVSSASSQAPRPGVIPPTEIMRRRREKAAAEASAEELRRQDEQPPRPQAQAGVAGQSSSQPPIGQQSQPSAHRRSQSSTTGRAATDPQFIPPYSSRPSQPDPSAGSGGGASANPPTQISQQQYETAPPAQQARPRATTQSTGQPRPVQATAGPSGTQRNPAPQQTRQPAQGRADPPLPGGPSGAGMTSTGRTAGHSASASQGTTASSFPHAFERWETLSSHWEGLTSYWIHRLEQNNDELRREPMLAQLSRQVTDLSAAGANLFHAVVELQRLRASSERKFQRWFFETRKEAERQQEITAQMEAALVSERQARANDAQHWEAQIEQARRTEANAQKLVGEMRRELQISKDEARRAWEELGRQEQQERDRTVALNQGQAIDVGGFTVYPKQFSGSGPASSSQRPGTRDGPLQPAQEQYPYEQGPSPTNTDPFIEARPRGSGEDQQAQGGASYPYASGDAYATSGSTTATVIPPGSSAPTTAASYRPAQASSSGAPSQERYPQFESYASSSAGVPTSAGFYHQANTHLAPGSTPPIPADEAASYVHSDDQWGSEQDDEDYMMDEHGQVLRDSHGNPIPYHRGLHPVLSQESDEYDVAEDARREQHLAQQYGTSSAVTYPSVPAPSRPSQQQQQQQQPTVSLAGPSMRPPPAPSAPSVPTTRPDYSGAGYGSDWDARHHHPTRLSDVLEMDEEERASRVSEMSQGANFGGNTGAPF